MTGLDDDSMTNRGGRGRSTSAIATLSPFPTAPAVTLDIAGGRAQGGRMSSPMPFIAMLRAATAADHDSVDARFGALRLDDAGDYRRMLRAHARALPAIEATLAEPEGEGGAMPAWRARTTALRDDLAALGDAVPPPLAFVAPTDAARWGALYVAEGSRLGGQLLARTVPAGLPSAYLSARHQPGEWRALLDALEQRAARADEAWREAAIAGARATFTLYAHAADVELGPVGAAVP